MNKELRDLIEVIHFTERLAAKIHGVLDKKEILEIVMKEFVQSERYTASILWLTDNGSKLAIERTSLKPKERKVGERIARRKLKRFKIDLKKSKIYCQVVKRGKTIQVFVSDIIEELFPRPLAYLIAKAMGYEKEPCILTPLKKDGKIIGAFAISSIDLAEYFIPSVKNLAQHISTALELADECAERKKAEEALRRLNEELEKRVKARTRELNESEGRFRGIFENSMIGLYRTTPEGRILMANPALVQMLGYSSFKELARRNLEKEGFVRGHNRMEFKKKIEKEGEVVALESAWMKRDGTTLFVRESARAIRDEGGKTLHYEGTVENITDWKRAEETMRNQWAAMEAAIDGIALTNKKEEFIYLNKAHVEIYGYDSPAELIGKTWRVLYDENGVRRLEQEVSPCLEKEGQWRGEVIGKRRNGSRFHQELSLTVIEGGGVVCVVRDITERKRAEAALRRSQERLKAYSKDLEKTVEERTQRLSQLVESYKEFTAHISHELRMPLATIKAAIEAILDEKEGRWLKSLKLANGKVDQITGILKNLALVSRLDTGQEQIHKTRFKLRRLMEEVLEDVIEETKGEGVVADATLTDFEEIELWADWMKLFEVLTNLVRNAIVHAQGRPVIFLKAREREGRVRIEVEDNNQLIPRKDLKKIFERYYRGQQRGGESGLGLGLYICRRLVELMDGKIWVESKKGGGNRFMVELSTS